MGYNSLSLKWTDLLSTIFLVHVSTTNLALLCPPHITRRDATRQDNPRQENRVMCGGLRHNATRQDKNRALSQISSIVRSLTTRPDFCLVVSRRVVDPRTLHDFLVRSCRVVSCRVMCSGHYLHLSIFYVIDNDQGTHHSWIKNYQCRRLRFICFMNDDVPQLLSGLNARK